MSARNVEGLVEIVVAPTVPTTEHGR